MAAYANCVLEKPDFLIVDMTHHSTKALAPVPWTILSPSAKGAQTKNQTFGGLADRAIAQEEIEMTEASHDIRIKSWANFQHFKDRRPPWIKLHRDILDRRDIHALSDRSFRVLIGLWLLASEDKDMRGTLPSVGDIAFRLRTDKSSIHSALEELCGFLVHGDSAAITPRYRDDDPETETETETETEESRGETYSLSSGDEGGDKKTTPYQEISDNWNSIARPNGFRICRQISSGRKKQIRARWSEKAWRESYLSAMDQLNADHSPFLSGTNDRGWIANIDWFLRPDTVAKILDGAYTNRDAYRGDTECPI